VTIFIHWFYKGNNVAVDGIIGSQTDADALNAILSDLIDYYVTTFEEEKSVSVHQKSVVCQKLASAIRESSQ